MDIVSDFVSSLLIGDPVTARNLVMIPLASPAIAPRRYMLFEEALETGKITVTEVSDSGSVPDLLLKNDTGQAVLMIDGETLVGAKQNRTLNVSIYAPAGTEMTIPVSCVEAGRWARRSQSMAASRDHMFASARARMMGDVHDAMDTDSRPRANQAHVWADIDRKMDRMGVSSRTRAMDDIFSALDDQIADFASAFQPQSEQVGAIFSLSGRVVGMDCFAFPDTFAALLPRLVRSYGLDALDERSEVPGRDLMTAEEFLLRVVQAPRNSDPSPGTGSHVRFNSNGVIGSALIVDNEVVHISAFWSQGDPDDM